MGDANRYFQEKNIKELSKIYKDLMNFKIFEIKSINNLCD